MTWRGTEPSLAVALLVLLGAIAIATALTLMGFNVDLAIQKLFYEPVAGWFPLEYDPTLGRLRDNGAIAVIVCGLCVCLAAARFLPWRLPFIRTRTAAYLLFSMILGPGIIVNSILKEFWGRYRPNEVAVFGRTAPYTDWWVLGDCRGNCSFVSGEVAAAVWLLAPALLLPAPWRTPAVTAVTLFAIFTATSRMAMGKHFLTDTLFAGVVTLCVLIALHRLVMVHAPERANAQV